MKTFAIIYAIILWLTASSQAAAPGWYTSGSHPRYVGEFYLVGIGTGESYEEATGKASAQIALQIEVKVETEINNVVSSYTEDDQEHIRSEYVAIGKTFAKASLKGAQVSEKAIANGIYYVLMTIDKDKYATGLLTELDQLKTEIKRLYDDSDALLNEGKIIKSLEVLAETGDMAARLQTQAALYSSISGNAYAIDDIITGPAILTKIRKLISKVKLEKVSGDDQSAQNGRLLAEPLVVRASINLNGELLPLQDLRLCLKDDNEVLERRYTDQNGEAEFWAYAIGEEKGALKASFDQLKIPALFKRDFSDIQTTFNYNITAIPPMKFAVVIFDERGARLRKVEKTVASSVQSAGHHINDDADFLLSGTVTLEDSREVEGLDGTQFLVNTELILFIEERESGEKVGSITLTGKGLDKKSSEKALKKSYNKLKVSRKEFTKALSEAADKLAPIREKLSKQALDKGKEYYRQGEYNLALQQFAHVTDGGEYIRESNQLIVEIKRLIDKKTSKEKEGKADKGDK